MNPLLAADPKLPSPRLFRSKERSRSPPSRILSASSPVPRQPSSPKIFRPISLSTKDRLSELRDEKEGETLETENQETGERAITFNAPFEKKGIEDNADSQGNDRTTGTPPRKSIFFAETNSASSGSAQRERDGLSDSDAPSSSSAPIELPSTPPRRRRGASVSGKRSSLRLSISDLANSLTRSSEKDKNKSFKRYSQEETADSDGMDDSNDFNPDAPSVLLSPQDVLFAADVDGAAAGARVLRLLRRNLQNFDGEGASLSLIVAF